MAPCSPAKEKEEHDSLPQPPIDDKTTEGKQRIRKWWPFILAPYFAGIVWHGLHPLASIFTGDLNNPRRSYIDENSLDPNHFKRDLKYPLVKPQNFQYKAESSLCQVLRSGTHTQTMIPCVTRGGLQVAKVVPTGTGISPVSEVSVLVVSATENWRTSQLHFNMVHLLTRLATSDKTPWLAKTVLLVAPSSSNMTLPDTVDAFLDLQQSSSPIIGGAVIRNLLVLDVVLDPNVRSETSELRILPQGRHGILPNMDLVFLCTNVYSRGLFSNVAMSQYRSRAINFLAKEPFKSLPPSVKAYLQKLLELLSFEYSLMAGPPGPHARALDGGIDSLTIQLVTTDNRKRDDAAAANVVTGLEYILRALSNLHERLHHSTSLYLLTSARAFVKHEEYLVPNLLVVIPCIVRAVTLIFIDLDRFCWSTAWRGLVSTLSCTVAFSVVVLPLLSSDDTNERNEHGSMERFSMFNNASAQVVLLAASFIPIVWFNSTSRREGDNGSRESAKDRAQTLQFLVCLLVVYTHVAIAFSHVSLAFPSAMFWSLLVALARFDILSSHSRKVLPALASLAGLLLYTSWGASVYIRYVQLPLLWMLSNLVIV